MNITSPFQQLSLQLYPFTAHKSVRFFFFFSLTENPLKIRANQLDILVWGGLFMDMIRNA